MENNLYLGIVDLSASLYAMVPTNESGVPTDADALPTYTIYGPDGAMTNGTGTTATVVGVTGLYDFTHAITSGNGYASGKTYFIRADWEVSSAARASHLTFTVV